MKLKLSGIPNIISEHEISRIFSELGTVTSVRKNFRTDATYITMKYEEQGRKAIEKLNGSKLFGHTITVEESE